MGLVRVGRAIFACIARKVLWLFELLYGGVPAEFASVFDLDESVARLSALTRVFPIFTRQRVAMGEVSKSFVSLRRPRSLSWDYAPQFKGEFCEIEGRVRLAGQFTLSSLVKTFMTIWLGAIVLFVVVAIRQMLAGHLRSWWAPLMGAALFASGVAGIRQGRREWHDDIAWVSRLIQDAFSDDARGLTPYQP